jgi:hypothetical protein
MADRYTSQIALVLDGPVPSVEDVVLDAGRAGDIDRGAAVRGDGAEAMEVHWGGRMQKAVVRRLVDTDDAHLLRTEAYIGDQGLKEGMRRQALLLQALARQLRGRVTAVRDLSAMTERDEAWMNRLTVGAVQQDDAIVHAVDGEGTRWLHTHGAARLDAPDLELYGLRADQVDEAGAVLRSVHQQLLTGGLKADLALPSGEPVYLVPVLEAWQHLNLDWPGVGRAGEDRGPGLDGPRATLSLMHKPRFGRYRTDVDGVLALIG